MPACSRFATPRRPERRTLGGHVARIAEHLGRPLLPWQRQVADVAFELLPDGRLAYRRVIVTVPRQQGKTLLTACVLALRAQDADQRLAYAAQTGLEGRRKWRDDWIPLLTPLGADFNMANGQETIRWPSGASVRLANGSQTSLHGAVLDMAVLDEAWAYSGDRLEAAILPAMIRAQTRRRGSCPRRASPAGRCI